MRLSAKLWQLFTIVYRLKDFQDAGAGVFPIRAGVFDGKGRLVSYRFIHTGMGVSFDIEGCGYEKMANGEFLAKPGDVVCLWPRAWHDLTEYQGEPLHTIWCELDGPAVPSIIRLFGATPESPIVRPSRTDEVYSLFKEMVAGFHARETLHPSHFLRRLYRVAELCAEGAVHGAESQHRPRETLVQRAVRICETGMLTFPTVAQLAKQLGVSQNTLLNACRKELGISAVQLIVRIKLQKAKELLRTTDHKLLHIAEASGFTSLSNFVHTFRASERCTPGGWREKMYSKHTN